MKFFNAVIGSQTLTWQQNKFVCIVGSFAHDRVDLVFIFILLTTWMSSCCQAGDAQLNGCQQHCFPFQAMKCGSSSLWHQQQLTVFSVKN